MYVLRVIKIKVIKLLKYQPDGLSNDATLDRTTEARSLDWLCMNESLLSPITRC